MSKSQVFLNRKVTLGLNLGCGYGGTCFREPYINLDYDRKKNEESWKRKKKPSKPPIIFIIADVQKLPFRDGVFDEVYASAILEHFNHFFTVSILKEWKRVLKPNGKIKVCVPDFQEVIRRYYEKKTIHARWFAPDGIPTLLHGPSQENSQHAGHKVIFDEELLRYMLEQAGYRNINKSRIHSCPYQTIKSDEICMEANK